VIQENAFERVGGTETIQVDSRIVAATNRDLEKMVLEGQFRDDLYYRLNVVSIEIPPLRQRRADILPLINHFLNKFLKLNQTDDKSFSKEALDTLLKYDYPGNVRELENLIEQAVVLSRGQLITKDDLPVSIQGELSETDISAGTLEKKVKEYEKKLIQEALNTSNGVQTKAAKLLGLTERNLRYKLTKYKMK
jgi:two-component system NtrC family response regulator